MDCNLAKMLSRKYGLPEIHVFISEQNQVCSINRNFKTLSDSSQTMCLHKIHSREGRGFEEREKGQVGYTGREAL